MHRPFDSFDIARSFISSGMKPELAEDVARAISACRTTDLSTLASKADLAEAESKLASKADLAEAESKLASKADLAEVENKLENKLASKADLAGVENKLEKQVLQVESRLALEIEKVRAEGVKIKSEIVTWFVGTAIASVAAMSGIVALLLKIFIR